MDLIIRVFKDFGMVPPVRVAPFFLSRISPPPISSYL